MTAARRNLASMANKPKNTLAAADAGTKAELDAAWAEWMKATSSGGKRSQGETWRRDNPGEWTKLKAYRDRTGARPTLATNTGRQMVAETAAWILASGSPTPPPPNVVYPSLSLYPY